MYFCNRIKINFLSIIKSLFINKTTRDTLRFKIKKYSAISIQEDGMDIQKLPYIGRLSVFYAKDFLTMNDFSDFYFPNKSE